MSPLNLISLPVDLREFRRIAALRGYGRDEGQALHHLLSEAFGKSVLKPFRLMVAPEGGGATLYAYCRQAVEVLKENLDCAAPELFAALGTAHLAVRDMPESWREGRRLAFDVRVRPMRRLLKPLEGWSREEHRRGLRGQAPKGPIKKGSEVDAFLVARLRQFPEGVPEAQEDALSREAIYLDWLVERFGAAATIDRDRTRLARFSRRLAMRKASGEADNGSEGPDATFHGELTVTDGSAFTQLLASGVGRHTSYGYGMMLLRPAGG